MRSERFVVAIALSSATCMPPVRTVDDVADPAVLCDAEGDRCLSVQLTPDPQYGHGRFGRTVSVMDGEQRLLSLELAPRWARAIRMNIYERTPGSFLIRECEYSVLTYEADLLEPRFDPVETSGPPTHLAFVGAFDEDAAGRWRFIPVGERGELPLPEPER